MPTSSPSSAWSALLAADLRPEALERLEMGLISDLAHRQAAKARHSLAEFVKQAWHIVEPSPFVSGWHVDAICEHLEAVYRGEIRRLLICIPPRHGKSLIVSILWPAWIWTHTPEWRSLFVSHSASLAVEHARLCRQLIESHWYRTSFCAPGAWALAADQNAKDHYTNTKGGHRYSIGMTGGITGHGGDLVAIDDPISITDSFSEAALNEAARIVGKVLPPRLNDQKTGRMLMIMQRANVKDPAQLWIDGGNAECLILPSEYEQHRACVTHRNITVPANGIPAHKVCIDFWRDPRTVEGEILCPGRFPPEVLASLKAADSMGAEGFSAQHQQNPMPLGGGMFKIGDWRFWREKDDPPIARDSTWSQVQARLLPEDMDEIALSVDATFGSKSKTASRVSILVGGKRGGERYLLERVWDRMDFDQTEVAILGVIRRWPAARIKIIEDKANGPGLINRLTNVHRIAGIIEGETRQDGKEKRANEQLPYQRSGSCYLPEKAPWLSDFIIEHALFPGPCHLGNDDVDAWSQLLHYFEEELTGASIIMGAHWGGHA